MARRKKQKELAQVRVHKTGTVGWSKVTKAVQVGGGRLLAQPVWANFGIVYERNEWKLDKEETR